MFENLKKNNLENQSTKSTNKVEYKEAIFTKDFNDSSKINKLKDRYYKVNFIYYLKNILYIIFNSIIFLITYEKLIFNINNANLITILFFLHLFISIKSLFLSNIIFLYIFILSLDQYRDYEYDVIVLVALLNCFFQKNYIKVIFNMILMFITKFNFFLILNSVLFFILIPNFKKLFNLIFNKYIYKVIKFNTDELKYSKFEKNKLIIYHKLLVKNDINIFLIENFIKGLIIKLFNNKNDKNLIRIIYIYLKAKFSNDKLKIKNIKKNKFIDLISKNPNMMKYFSKISEYIEFIDI